MKTFFLLLGGLILTMLCTLPFIMDYYTIIREKYGKPIPKKYVKLLLFLIFISVLIDIVFIMWD